jgi:hypothetical protein
MNSEQLTELANKLNRYQYIDDDSVNLFPYHFCFNNKESEFDENLKKINWVGNLYILISLFEELDNKDVFDADFYQSKYVQISNHFYFNGKGLDHIKLAKNSKNVTEDKTKNIRTIVNEVIGK